MALHIFTKDSFNDGGGWSEVDIADESIYGIKLTVSYSTPARLNFSMVRPENELPFLPDTPIIFYDDASYTFNNPNFEGYVAEISPAGNNNLNVECLDNTMRMTKEIPIMSAAWEPGDPDDNEPPTEGLGAVPRLVFNVTIDNDDDFAFARTVIGAPVDSVEDILGIPNLTSQQVFTVGEMIETILNDAYEPLLWINAANADGTSYYPADFTLMSYQPQEKQVFESESIRSGIERLLTQQPSIRYLWIPGPDNRKFKFVDARTSPTKTLTLNKHEGVSHPVLTMQMQRSCDRVRTAVKVYGPESTATQTIATSNLEDPTQNDGALYAYDRIILEEFAGESVTRRAIAYRKYIIRDETKRRSANLLGTSYIAGAGSYNFFSTRSPTVEASFDGGVTWLSMWGWTFDTLNGIIDFGDNYPYFWKDNSAAGPSQRNFFTPTHVRLTHSYYINPLSVRWPASGFSGTGFDIAGIKTVHRFYDEMLAVGFERGTAVTTLSRVTQFRELCRRLLETMRDIVYVGGCTLDGLDYSYARLNKRINIAAVDQDGDALVTGWENIGAILTEVEYDYENSLTTLSFSHDLADYLGWSIDFLKERLKIRALQQVRLWTSIDLTFRAAWTSDLFYFSADTGVEEGITGSF
jgi:hypothetical protein